MEPGCTAHIGPPYRLLAGYKQADIIARFLDDILNIDNIYFNNMVNIRKAAKIRNRYNQVPHLT